MAEPDHVVEVSISLPKVTLTDDPPRSVVFKAWADSYIKHAFHHCPVVEQRDLSSPVSSSVLHKAISMAGNLMRHDPSGPTLAQGLYERVKTLIYANHEKDMVKVLKAMCLISLWSGLPCNPVRLDGPWHWIGLAVRLVLQMGLNRESIYRDRPNAGCLRRIFWQLHVCDVSWVMEATLSNRCF